jgi:hypothetical protein
LRIASNLPGVDQTSFNAKQERVVRLDDIGSNRQGISDKIVFRLAFRSSNQSPKKHDQPD